MRWLRPITLALALSAAGCVNVFVSPKPCVEEIGEPEPEDQEPFILVGR